MHSEYAIVLTTAPTESDASNLARGIVEAGLAACVHIDTMRSIYRWQSKLHNEPEWRLTIKTTAARYVEIERYIKTHHTYQTPEIVCIEIAGGSREYLDWIDESVR